MQLVIPIPSALIARRLRWALAFLSSAAVLGVGVYIWGGFDALGIAMLVWTIRVIATALAVLGLVAGLSALVESIAANGKKTALLVGLGLGGVVVLIGLVLFVPLTGLLVAPAILTIVILLSITPQIHTSKREDPGWRNVLLAVGFAVLTLAILVVGVLQITVWNPLAKLPGMSLDEIYSAMEAANQPTGDSGIAIWVGFWALGALLLIVAATVRPLSGIMTARRTIAAGLLLVGASASTHWLAAFAMGMNLADTFYISGGDANSIGILLGLIGHMALAAGLIVGLAPTPFFAKPKLVNDLCPTA